MYCAKISKIYLFANFCMEKLMYFSYILCKQVVNGYKSTNIFR